MGLTVVTFCYYGPPWLVVAIFFQLEGKEINQIQETYETAIRGLKDEIEKQQKECDELKRMNAELSQNLVV